MLVDATAKILPYYTNCKPPYYLRETFKGAGALWKKINPLLPELRKNIF